MEVAKRATEGVAMKGGRGSGRGCGGGSDWGSGREAVEAGEKEAE